MTEAAPRATPENSPETPIINAAPDALQLERLDSVVGYGSTIADEYDLTNDDVDYETFRAQKIDELLAENGIVDGEDDDSHAQYELARDVYAQVIDLSQDEWIIREEGAEVPRRNVIFRRLLAEYPTETTQGRHERVSEQPQEAESYPGAAEADEEKGESGTESTGQETSPVDMDALHEEALAENARYERNAVHGEALIDNARYDVDGARNAWSTVSAKRQGRAFGKASKHDEVRDDYHAKVQSLGILELKDQINPEDDETTKNAQIIAYLFEEQRRLRELTTEKLQGTKVGKFVKFMNKGKLGTRLMKGFGVGLVVGAGGTVLLGAAGAAAGAAVAIGASRFVKGYASNDRHRGMQTAEESFMNENGESVVEMEPTEGYTVKEKFASAAKMYNEDFEADTKQEQVKRQKALAWGVGSVAVGAGVGYALVSAADHSGAVIDGIKDWWNGPDEQVVPPGKDEIFDMDGDGIADDIDKDRDGDGVVNRLDDAPNNPDVTERGNDWSEFSRDARFVVPGEGGFQTLKEMGIPQQKWESIWQDAGTVLHEQGKTYMMQDGRWGWSDDMRLTERDLDVLADAAGRHGVKL
jgi:hypothetical protein